MRKSVLPPIGFRELSRGCWGCVFLIALFDPVLALGASGETEIGVTAASNIAAVGKPPVSPARDLETGVDIFFSEKIKTDVDGRAQLLFLDGTTLTVGAGSEMVIDEYLYDPASGTGEMAVSLSKGVFRLVGGKISKKKAIQFNTPAATIAVRGGIAMFDVSEKTKVSHFYGHTTIMNAAGSSEAFKPSTLVASRDLKPEPPKPIDRDSLKAQLKSLEKTSKPREDKTVSEDTADSQKAEQSQEDSDDQAQAASDDEPEDQGGQSDEARNEDEPADKQPADDSAGDGGDETDQSQADDDRSPGPQQDERPKDADDQSSPPDKDSARLPAGDDAGEPREDNDMRTAKAREEEPPGTQLGKRPADDEAFDSDGSKRQLTATPGTDEGKKDEFFEKEPAGSGSSGFLTKQESEKFDPENPDREFRQPSDQGSDQPLIDSAGHEGQGERPEDAGFFSRMMSTFGIGDDSEPQTDDDLRLTRTMSTSSETTKDKEPLPSTAGGAGPTVEPKGSAVGGSGDVYVAPATKGDWTPDLLSKEDHEKFDREFSDIKKGEPSPFGLADGEHDPDLGTDVTKSRGSTESMSKLDTTTRSTALPDLSKSSTAIPDLPKASTASTGSMSKLDTTIGSTALPDMSGSSPASHIATLTDHFGEKVYSMPIDRGGFIEVEHDHHSHELTEEVTEVSKESSKGEAGTLAPITVATTSRGEKVLVVEGDVDKVLHASPGAGSDIKVYSVAAGSKKITVAKMDDHGGTDAVGGSAITCTDGHCYVDEHSSEVHPVGSFSSDGHKDDDGTVGKYVDDGGRKDSKDEKDGKDKCDPRRSRCEEEHKEEAKDDRKEEAKDDRKEEAKDADKPKYEESASSDDSYVVEETYVPYYPGEPYVPYDPETEKFCDPVVEMCRASSVATLVWSSGDQLGFEAEVMGAPSGSWADSREITHLCSECRFLDWGRFAQRGSTPDSSRIRYWLAGASATAAQMAAAADKTATYSGGMIGGVVQSGGLIEQQGSFQSQVQFGLTHYQINTFNASFDGMRFTGAGGRTANDVPFGVTATSHYEALNESRAHTMSGQGYFYGTSAAGQPPPEMGGNFQITGDNYQAGGVFVGGRD